MHLTRLALTDFRSYTSADLTLTPGVTTLSGPNGEGKTNLAEAIGYVATLGSHRVSSDAPLVRQGAERAIVRAAVSSPERDSLVELEINPGRANRARVNRVPVPRPRQVLGILRTVLFAPEDLALVKGDPDQRRRYLDELLVVAAPRYAAVRSDYERVVKQRTALLKSGRAHRLPEGALETWDDHLVRTGVELLAGRAGLTSALRPLVAKAYAAVSGEDGAAGINYRQRSVEQVGESTDRDVLAARLRDALARVRSEELDRGVCLVGPHRDDLDLTIGSLPARGYASHGESWSMALALRLAAYELLRSDGDDPVLLLDDVFAELDDERRARLAALVAGAEQVLVTAAVPADVPASLDGPRYQVGDGKVVLD